ncbi:hypothetical protein FA95DRAFT_1654039, partial [Auriscalpium vulgare]
MARGDLIDVVPGHQWPAPPYLVADRIAVDVQIGDLAAGQTLRRALVSPVYVRTVRVEQSCRYAGGQGPVLPHAQPVRANPYSQRPDDVLSGLSSSATGTSARPPNVYVGRRTNSMALRVAIWLKDLVQFVGYLKTRRNRVLYLTSRAQRLKSPEVVDIPLTATGSPAPNLSAHSNNNKKRERVQEVSKTLFPVSRYSPAARSYQAWCDRIDFKRKTLECMSATPSSSAPQADDKMTSHPGAGTPFSVRYDKLVIAVSAYSQ